MIDAAPIPEIVIPFTKDPQWMSYRDAFRILQEFERYQGDKEYIDVHFALFPKNRQESPKGMELRLFGESTRLAIPLHGWRDATIPLSQTAFDESADFVINRKAGTYDFEYAVSLKLPGKSFVTGRLQHACDQVVRYLNATNPAYRDEHAGQNCQGVSFYFLREQQPVNIRLVGQQNASAADVHPRFAVYDFRFNSMGIELSAEPFTIVPWFQRSSMSEQKALEVSQIEVPGGTRDPKFTRYYKVQAMLGKIASYGRPKDLVETSLVLRPHYDGASIRGARLWLMSKNGRVDVAGPDEQGRLQVPLLKDDAEFYINRRAGLFGISTHTSLKLAADGVYTGADLRERCQQALDLERALDEERGKDWESHRCHGVYLKFPKSGPKPQIHWKLPDDSVRIIDAAQVAGEAYYYYYDFDVTSFRDTLTVQAPLMQLEHAHR